MDMTLINILFKLQQCDISVINRDTTLLINNKAMEILNTKDVTPEQIYDMENIIWISNILYNNTDNDNLPLEDGVYDLLLELYKKYNPNYQIGAEPIKFDSTNDISTNKQLISAIELIDKEKMNDFLFVNDLSKEPRPNMNDFLIPCITFENDYISKRVVDTKHMYPELVGSLDKCKFVLNSQADERGVLDDPKVRVFERDFFQKHINSGVLDPNRVFSMILELKYDGLSVEGEVSNIVHTARTRGDANADIGADITPILNGYSFKHAKDIPSDERFGMKFEAIMTYDNLWKYNLKRGKTYKNCRTAISGLFSSSDAADYREFITLVPLATSLHLDRLTEVEFMNKYYHSGEYLRYSIITGKYVEILFQIKRFVEEADYMRSMMPFMYDGVVVSYIDEDLINKLGRSNSINQYSTAIKFNPMVKQSIFRGYEFTVGQDGSITPMIYYDPVEFYGTIHNHSTGHSYERFKNLSLREGDIIDIEYTNEVMPYVSKPDNSFNANNTNQVIEFISTCPSCGRVLQISKTGKTVFCENIECPERNIKRMVGMLQKLNLKDFSEATLSSIAKFSLSELLDLEKTDVAFIGDLNSDKFIERMNDLRTTPIYDYKLIGAIGFTGVAIEKWKLILSVYTLSDILNMTYEELKNSLIQIKGIGPMTADTLIEELDFHRKDVECINKMSNVISTKGMESVGKKIRFTGFRSEELVNQLVAMGHDANGNAGVTKSTDILLIPYNGYQSSKINNIGESTLVISLGDFLSDIDRYLAP